MLCEVLRFVREDVVDDDDTFTGPASVVGLLEKLQSLFVQLIFVPVVLGEKLVESAFAFGWKHVRGDAVYGLVAGRNKTGDVGLGVMLLPVEKHFKSSIGAVQDRNDVSGSIRSSRLSTRYTSIRCEVK